MTPIIGSSQTLPRAFPVLTREQIERIRPMGCLRHVQTGDVLFQPGDTTVPFFVLLSGRIEITQPARAPEMLETSRPGVFAVGDVRAGNVKRVASAVGEGAISIHLAHRVLADL